MAKLLLLNGPNLNLLGQREPDIYGHETLSDIERNAQEKAATLGHQLDYLQSNHEGVLVDRIHQTLTDGTDMILFNPGAFTHTSIALRDALAGVKRPFIELHLSNVHAREDFRHHSYLAPLAVGVIAGFGSNSYALAIEAADHYLKK
ncbi:type II 3-dehydroquinate dehydratase [Reinekea blandensis]|uniref:3-dehydroquinate dehydratase n=1 Tax=Reinekea blandensis MED297 TaxID=314283 RepID=A4BFT3_9GAMM|nr:type II 3-dehydroquinate dehydratase [Reinekea blandensis]EAR08951.1 chorismate mutase, putative [Reinekea sp. MED297] [Reinekea blandensis MED297]